MAERRMFAKTIIDSDGFLDMPLSTQALYFHLAMRADDDGFINNPKSIMRNVKCREDDFKLLCVKEFLIPFESGVVVVKHWKIHNYIQKDRYNETKYKSEKALLQLDENNSYQLCPAQMYTECIQGVHALDTQVRLGKVSLGKVRDKENEERFAPPTLEQVSQYCLERKNAVDPQRFIDHYTSNGWMIGKNPMKDWKAAVRNWEASRKNDKSRSSGVVATGGSGEDSRPRLDFTKLRPGIQVPEVQG